METRIECLKQIKLLYSLTKESQRWAVQDWWDRWYDRIWGPSILLTHYPDHVTLLLKEVHGHSMAAGTPALMSMFQEEEMKGKGRKGSIPAALAH